MKSALEFAYGSVPTRGTLAGSALRSGLPSHLTRWTAGGSHVPFSAASLGQ